MRGLNVHSFPMTHLTRGLHTDRRNLSSAPRSNTRHLLFQAVGFGDHEQCRHWQIQQTHRTIHLGS